MHTEYLLPRQTLPGSSPCGSPQAGSVANGGVALWGCGDRGRRHGPVVIWELSMAMEETPKWIIMEHPIKKDDITMIFSPIFWETSI